MRKIAIVVIAVLFVAIFFDGMLFWRTADGVTREGRERNRQILCVSNGKDLGYFKRPFLGFTEETEIGGQIFAGWYLVEAEHRDILPFKAFFFEGVFVEGLEIGERFETPKEKWGKVEFVGQPTILETFEMVSKSAPRCAPALR